MDDYENDEDLASDPEKSPFPGCCGIDVIYELNNTSEETVTDIATRPEGIFLATTAEENEPEAVKSLEGAGFKKVLSFRNGKTGNQVVLWAKGKFKRLGEKKSRKPKSPAFVSRASLRKPRG